MNPNLEMNTASRAHGFRAAILAMLVFLFGAIEAGCGANCKRINADRTSFFERTEADESPHIEVLVPFVFAERLIDKQLEKVKPVPLKLPVSGDLQAYFGNFEVVPTQVRLLPARKSRIGFQVNFDVKHDGAVAFSMGVETEITPVVDFETGKLAIGLAPEAFGSVRPVLSQDAKKRLGTLVYRKIPKIVRGLIPKSMVDSAAAKVLKKLVTNFYEQGKDKLLPRLGMASKVAVDLPNVPSEKLTFDSFKERGGGLRLRFYSGLPIEKGVGSKRFEYRSIKPGEITVRMSGSAVAELANWAIREEKVPTRYNRKGKPKKDGEFQPGLAYVPGKRPMKVILWQTERPCKRITIGTTPTVSVKNDKIQIRTENTEIEDIEARALTELGIWFATLWKDAVDVRKSAASKMKFSIAGRPMISKIKRASLEDDELLLGIGLEKM